MNSNKKLSFWVAVFLSLTCMIGAGIFIKVRYLNELSHHNMVPVIFLFLFFLMVIFSFMYVFSKIISEQTGDMGFVEWSKMFCKASLHASFCRFVRHLYYPASLFLFSTYGVIGITGEKLGIFSTFILAFLVVFIFIAINFISFRWAKIMQTVLFTIVLIPIFSLPIIAMSMPGDSSVAAPQSGNSNWSSQSDNIQATGLDSLGPWLILISGLPSLLFIYDGFYNISSLKSRLKNPKNLKFIVLTSLFLITLIYLFVIIGFNVGDPRNADFKNFRYLRDKPMLVDFFELSISCASFLTLNSIIISGIPQLSAMQDVHKFKDEFRVKNFLFYKNKKLDISFEKKASILFIVLVKTFFWFVIIGLIMFFVTRYNLIEEPMEIINSIADVVTIFIFLILVSVISGSFKLESRKIRNDKLFTRCSKLCIFVIFVSLGYLFISYFVGLTGFAQSNALTSFIKLFILVLFFLICFYEQIYFFLMRRFKKRLFQLYPEYPEDSRINLK